MPSLYPSTRLLAPSTGLKHAQELDRAYCQPIPFLAVTLWIAKRTKQTPAQRDQAYQAD